MAAVYRVEQDWLFEKLMGKLNSQRHIILSADQDWGVQEYVSELGIQLAEKYPDIHICYMDMKPARSTTAFLELFSAAIFNRLPEVTSRLKIDSSSTDILGLPELIAKRENIRIAVFLANAHLFHRFRDVVPFLRILKGILKNQKNCVFCLYGKNSPHYRDLVHYPGPLSGLGQVFELRHNPSNHRSASIRRLFRFYNKGIEYTASVHMSYAVDNHPFYLKLLAWHALIRTDHTCTLAIIEKALNDLIHHFDDHFLRIAESMTTKQLSFLQALIEGNQKLHTKTIREAYHLGSSSNVSKIKINLENKEIIQSGDMGIGFTDPVFREWLRRRYFGS